MEILKKYSYLIIGVFSLIFVFFVYLIKNDQNTTDKDDNEDDEIIPMKKNKLKEIARKNKELKDKINGKSITTRNSKPDKSTITSGKPEEGKGATKEGNEPEPNESEPNESEPNEPNE